MVQVTKQTSICETDKGAVQGKECRQCKQWQPLEEFPRGEGVGGRRATCKTCYNRTTKRVRRGIDVVTIAERGQNFLAKMCTECEEVKSLEDFAIGRSAGGRVSKCRQCRSRIYKVPGARSIKVIEKPPRRTQPRILTKITPELWDGVETDGKICTGCGQWKPLEQYQKGKGVGGRMARCKKCTNLTERIVSPPAIISSQLLNGFFVEGKQCTGCSLWKPLDEFYPHQDGTGGRSARCKTCLTKTGRKRRYRVPVVFRKYKM